MKIDSSEWLVRNFDGLTTWDTTATYGLFSNTYSATMQMYDYAGSKQFDELITPNITLPNQDSIFLRFDLAYQLIHPVISDTLKIFISDDCGISFTEIYNKTDSLLETHDTLTIDFLPLYAHHWRKEYVDITSYANSNIILKFVTANRSGNNLYLDNIWVYEGAEPVGIKEEQIESFSIYPNPTENIVTVDLGNNKLQNAKIEILNLLGESIFQKEVSQKNNTVNLSKFSNGIYLIKFSNDKGSNTKKIIKQ